MAALFAVDIADTMMKGYSYYHRLGVTYALRTGVFLGFA